jgi:aryl-alcohol dehydrogenase-like predicted oxidoreductase
MQPTIAALKFCLSFPCVSTVIPGMRNKRQAEVNCSASDKRALPALPAALVARLRTLFQEGALHPLPSLE